ncbi:hypothetical protein EVAR_13211_1 [Eumeta japonica]|uniref:Uncharacterized protein n=1 Tax=Eumeta variegata TaxID=151549 RepID=A0A4C1TSM5_EUMVA|nr:hypothetical protein EVAR_13211_1 [Eumeta japonica]
MRRRREKKKTLAICGGVDEFIVELQGVKKKLFVRARIMGFSENFRTPPIRPNASHINLCPGSALRFDSEKYARASSRSREI